MGDIVFADIIKQDSKDALKNLRKLGIKETIMMTGDKEVIAKDIAKKADIDTVYSRLMPDEKANIVSELQKSGKTVVYTGDGINDAPVLSQAYVMGDSLSKLAIGKKAAKKTIRIVYENIIFAIAVKLLIIIGCAVGIFNENAMWLAVFGDVGVCLIAIANSLRALRVGKIKNDK